MLGEWERVIAIEKVNAATCAYVSKIMKVGDNVEDESGIRWHFKSHTDLKDLFLFMANITIG